MKTAERTDEAFREAFAHAAIGMTLTSLDGRYLLVSEHMLQGNSDDDIFGQFFDASLVKVGTEFRISTNSWNQNRAAVASNGADFFVTWTDEQMWGQVRGSPVRAIAIVPRRFFKPFAASLRIGARSPDFMAPSLACPPA